MYIQNQLAKFGAQFDNSQTCSKSDGEKDIGWLEYNNVASQFEEFGAILGFQQSFTHLDDLVFGLAEYADGLDGGGKDFMDATKDAISDILRLLNDEYLAKIDDTRYSIHTATYGNVFMIVGISMKGDGLFDAECTIAMGAIAEKLANWTVTLGVVPYESGKFLGKPVH